MEGLGTSGPIIPRASMTYPILGLSFKVPNINCTHYGTPDCCQNLRLGCKIRARGLQRFFLGGMALENHIVIPFVVVLLISRNTSHTMKATASNGQCP